MFKKLNLETTTLSLMAQHYSQLYYAGRCNLSHMAECFGAQLLEAFMRALKAITKKGF